MLITHRHFCQHLSSFLPTTIVISANTYRHFCLGSCARNEYAGGLYGHVIRNHLSCRAQTSKRVYTSSVCRHYTHIFIMSPTFEWQTASIQSACADETQSSFDRHTYPTLQNHLLFGKLSLTEGTWLIVHQCERKTLQTCGPPPHCRNLVSGRSIFSRGETLILPKPWFQC